MIRFASRSKKAWGVWATLLAVILAWGAAWPTAGFAQEVHSEIVCDPTNTFDPVCEGGECRRIAGDCSFFGISNNELCLDDPDQLQATATGWDWWCNWICEDVEGRCEGDVVPCNADRDCLEREFCRNGVCTEVECRLDRHCPGNEVCRDERCVPECEVDADCDGRQVCLDRVCTTVECTTIADCNFGFECIENRCCNRCPAGSFWVVPVRGEGPLLQPQCVTFDDTCESRADCPVGPGGQATHACAAVQGTETRFCLDLPRRLEP